MRGTAPPDLANEQLSMAAAEEGTSEGSERRTRNERIQQDGLDAEEKSKDPTDNEEESSDTAGRQKPARTPQRLTSADGRSAHRKLPMMTHEKLDHARGRRRGSRQQRRCDVFTGQHPQTRVLGQEKGIDARRSFHGHPNGCVPSACAEAKHGLHIFSWSVTS